MAVRLPPNPTDENSFMDIANGHGYSAAVKYTWEGKESCRNIASAMDAWCKAEEAHATALQKIAKSCSLPSYSETGSTLNTSWEALKLGLEFHNKTAQEFAKLLREQESSFVAFRHKQSKEKRSLEAEAKAAAKALADAKSTTASLEKKYKSACKATEGCITKREHGKNDPKATEDKIRKLNEKVNKSMLLIEKCDNNYQVQVDTLNLVEISHREKMDRVLQDLQIVEETRITTSKDLLSTVSEGAMKMFQKTQEGYGGSLDGVACIEAQTDIKRFVMRQCSEANAKGHVPPRLMKTLYSAYESTTLDQEGRTSTRKVSVDISSGETKTRGSNSSSRAPPSHPGGQRGPPHPGKIDTAELKAPSKFVPQTPAMGGGAPSRAPPRPTSSAPSSGPSGPPPGMSGANDGANDESSSTSSDADGKIWARSTFTFDGQEADDLSFSEGDLIQITDKTDDSWWKGKLNGIGKIGNFPSNYTDLIFKDGRMRNGIARYDFSSDEPGEISFKEGDRIDVIAVDDSSGWWEGRRSVRGKIGLFPSNRVTVKNM